MYYKDPSTSNMNRVSKRKWRRRLSIIVCLIIGFFLLSKVMWRYPSNWVLSEDGSVFEFFADDPPLEVGEQHERWIVVTTIHNPSSAVKLMSEMPGWWVVVVADTKTPTSWSPESLSNVVYLDMRTQKKLGYAVHTLVSQNNYARKIIGYLYAIQHGAHYIYDTDDDTVPLDNLNGFNLTPLSNTEGLLVNTNNLTHNPYPHFGQSTLWPRGYPLNRLEAYTPHEYTLCTLHNPAIKQGLINNDPDIDAVARMTRKNSNVKIEFDSASPPVVLPKGTFVPVNTQSMLVTYEAMWSLVLPHSLSMRTVDIVRGYWMQPLLWLIDERVGYYPAVATHHRNPHNLLNDAQSEQGFYNVDKLLHVLSKWTCGRPHFFACVTDLSALLAREGFLTQSDVDLINAWLTDLAMVGYFPPIIKDTRTRECADKGNAVQYYAVEQPTSMVSSASSFVISEHHAGHKASVYSRLLCNQSIAANHGLMEAFNEELLVIGVKESSHISVLEAWYRSQVSLILYCASQDSKIPDHSLSYVLVDDVNPVSCLRLAMRMHFNVSGYLYTDENSLLSVQRLSGLRQSQLWLTSEVFVSNQKLCTSGQLKCEKLNKDIVDKLSAKLTSLDAGTKLKTKLKKCFDAVASGAELKVDVWALVDQVVHIPDRAQRTFLLLADLFIADKAVRGYAMVIPLVLDCIELTPEALSFSDSYVSNYYYFPFPISDVIKENESRKQFCEALSNNDKTTWK